MNTEIDNIRNVYVSDAHENIYTTSIQQKALENFENGYAADYKNPYIANEPWIRFLAKKDVERRTEFKMKMSDMLKDVNFII